MSQSDSKISSRQPIEINRQMGANVENYSDRQFELDKQLHEQYAINNNANVSSFVAFISAFFILFGIFGYAFANSDSETVRLVFDKCCCADNKIVPLKYFYALSASVSIVLLFLALLSLHFGASQRRDQLVIHRIRRKYYKPKYTFSSTFGSSYNPHKSSEFYDFIPGFYDLFYWLFTKSQVVVFVCCVIKHLNFSNSYIFLLYLVQFALIVIALYYRYIKLKKYRALLGKKTHLSKTLKVTWGHYKSKFQNKKN